MKEDERRILTAEMMWLRRLLRVTRRDKMRNETVRGILCQETTLVDRIAEPRLNWFGHVSRMGSERLPAKTLRCYINGKRNQGRQPKKWTDNVNEDMEAKKLTVQQAMVLVWDRNKWKHQVYLIIIEMMEESRREKCLTYSALPVRSRVCKRGGESYVRIKWRVKAVR